MPEHELLESITEIDNACDELPKLDGVLADLSGNIKNLADFDFVAIQLRHKEDQTIETIHSVGLSLQWFALAKHNTRGTSELWDIQAHIASSSPPRIEIIAGRDRRFDEYIFRKFDHDRLVRVFLPIILLPSGVTLQSVHWDEIKVLPSLDKPRRNKDRRTVLEMRIDGVSTNQPNVIGTVEAGYNDSSREIPLSVVRQMAMVAGQRAPDLYHSSLENVFSAIAQSAMRVVRADAASLHFARNDKETEIKSVHYIYEVFEGRRFLSRPRSNGLGQQALQRRRTLFVPNRKRKQDADYFRENYQEAYQNGMKAVAVVPMFFRDESERLYGDRDRDARRLEKEGLLYVGFTTEHSVTKEEVSLLELLAGRAVEAIRRATYYTRTRDRARRLNNMHILAQSLADDPGSPSLLEEIAGVTLNVLAADVVSVYEYDQRHEKFVSSRPTIAGQLIKRDLLTTSDDHMSAPALLLQNPENIYEYDVISNATLTPKRGTAQFEDSFVAREEIKSTAAAVLRGGGTPDNSEKPREEILGLLFVNFRTFHQFTSEEIMVIETLASTAAITIWNQRRRFGSAERLEKAAKAIAAIGRAAPRQIARVIERLDERIDERIDERVNQRLASPSFDNFDGIVTVSIWNSDNTHLNTEPIEDGPSPSLTATYLSAPDQSCGVIVQFSAGEANSSATFKKRLVIKDGNSAKTVTFDVTPDSNSIDFDPEYASTTLNTNNGSSSVEFGFKTPQDSGRYDILVEVSQKNRLVEVIPVSIKIHAALP
jgi:GAF domain-containing protein